ncbi:outer membrane beta-barrel protein [Flavihumibacter sp.]|uniref:outer membrane beta-barrel protein n=1 Tax=Flavihumibacter sp. TaxID=1913981 RepID=UPI002FC81C89
MPGPEFDRNLQAKMQELQLEPSPAVWEGVEAQLHKRKRRRGIIWFFLLASFLTAGGITWYNQNSTSPIAINKTENKDSHPSTTERTNSTPQQKKINEDDLRKQDKHLSELDKTDHNNNTIGQQKNIVGPDTKLNIGRESDPETAISQRDIDKSVAKRAGGQELDKNKAGRKPLAGQTTEQVQLVIKQNTIPTEDGEKFSIQEDIPNDPNAYTRFSLHNNSKDFLIPEPRRVVGDNNLVVQNSLPKKKDENKKLSWNIDFGLGASSLQEGILQQYNAVANDYLAPTSVPAGLAAIQRRPSAVTAAPAFKIGASFSRPLSKRTAVSVGLQYNYMSNKIEIGKAVDSALTLYGQDQQRLDVGAAYNGAGNNGEAFYNRYHLLQMPLEFAWNFDRAARWSWNSGLTIGYLIGSDALLYNKQAGVYYRDDNALNKWQTGIHTSINYGLLRSDILKVAVGPFASYQLNSPERTNSKKHLLMIGIGARIQFKAKN